MFIKGLHEKEIYTERFPFRMTENNREDFEYPLHWHNAVELLYVKENSLEVTVNNKNIPLKEKDFLYIAPGDIHGFSFKKAKGHRIIIQFEPARLEGLGTESIKPNLLETGIISKDETGETHNALEEQIQKLIQEYRQKTFAYQFTLNARLFDIMAILLRSSLNKSLLNIPPRQASRIHGLEKLGKALSFMEEKYMEELSLKEVAMISGFSEYHFSRIFKEIMEKNFHSYLNELRIKKAEKLLSDQGLQIAQIATMSGFNSFSTFNRIFKEIKGCPPTMYRKYKLE